MKEVKDVLIEMILQKEHHIASDETGHVARWQTDTLEYAFDELKELRRLAEIGRATEKAIEHDFFGALAITRDSIHDVESLLEWYKGVK